ncbi:MAG: UDP-N-acetylmuramate dehydrogenase [Candidatus Paceibacterota bacterium]|jgi:UDP-N-acetylmuramate dehydrogenase
MLMQENVILSSYTTFHLGGPARFFCRVETEDQLLEAVEFANKKKLPILILGGGSNVLISDSGYAGLVIKIEIMGIDWQYDNDGDVIVNVRAGENWDEFVKQTVDRGLYGLEALSAIPGTVGAAPIQNIGAYGVDVANHIEKVRALDMNTLKYVYLSKDECQFGYRDSIFKKRKGLYIVSSVVFKISKSGRVKMNYADVKEYFATKQITDPTLVEVRQAVIEIRHNKLPDWTKWGTAGSFFKNPIITAEHFDKLKTKYPGLVGFSDKDGKVKVSLGWILEHVCNVKGVLVGNVGTYKKQALVLVTKPGATSSEVVAFAKNLMNEVKEMTDIDVEVEVDWTVA